MHNWCATWKEVLENDILWISFMCQVDTNAYT